MDGEEIRKEQEPQPPFDEKKADRDARRGASFQPDQPFDRKHRDTERQVAFKPVVNIPCGVMSAMASKKLGTKPDLKYFQPNPRDEKDIFRAAGPALDLMPPKLPPMPSSTPPEFKTGRGGTGFYGGKEVKLRGIEPVRPKIGEFCGVRSQDYVIKPPPLMPERKPMDVMGVEHVIPPRDLETMKERFPLPPTPKPSQVPPLLMPPTSQMHQSQMRPPAAFEEPKPGISIERIVFLERVERIMASEARIKEIEAENKTLVGMVSRLNKELEELKAKLAARS